MIRVGVFGGAFNPIHNGHINLCKQCIKICSLDKILLIPTNVSPHKQIDYPVSFEHRYNMVELAIKNEPDFSISDIEYMRGGISYTYDTIIELQHNMPDAEFSLIIGSDMLEIFNKWYKYDQLLNSVDVIVGARNSGEYESLLKIKRDVLFCSDKVQITQIDVQPMSSTQIRYNLANGIDVDDLINSDVYGYIKAESLYG